MLEDSLAFSSCLQAYAVVLAPLHALTDGDLSIDVPFSPRGGKLSLVLSALRTPSPPEDELQRGSEMTRTIPWPAALYVIFGYRRHSY